MLDSFSDYRVSEDLGLGLYQSPASLTPEPLGLADYMPQVPFLF